jgi:penicillin-binding protein 1A
MSNSHNTPRKGTGLLRKVAQACNRGWQWYRHLYKGPWYKKVGVGVASFIVFVLIFLGAVDINFLWLFGRSPGFSDIKHPVNSEASEIYSADGVMIGKYFNENRTPVTYGEISPKIVHTLIDTEDVRFYHHFGIDFEGLFAAAKDMAHGNARGASTITQQLAKNLFRVRTQYSTGLIGKIPGLKIVIMKAKEWIVALKLEYCFSKKDILTMYFNTVDFGSNAYGIKTACRFYFATTPDQLTYEQAATLVGLLKATSAYNPRTNPENSVRRRNVVLENLYNCGDMKIEGHAATMAQYDSIRQIPLEVSKKDMETNYDGKAPYFREALADYIADLCKRGEVEDADADNPLDLYADGLKIYTTLDTRMQQYAEDAALKEMKLIQQRFKNHWGNTNPWQDENHQEIPHFIEDLAKKSLPYQMLLARFPNRPDSIDYYMNLPHPVKLFDYNQGTKEEMMSSMDSIRYMVRFMHCSFVAMEPNTGYVKAWVGDIDFNSWKYDKVTAERQPGSTFKLFVYTEAMNQGLTPCDKRRDEYISMKVTDKHGKETLWQPHNANGNFTGDSMYLKAAFAQSVNSIAVRLGQEVGISNVIRTAHAMGIESPLDDNPSLALGSSDVTLLELVNSYCTIINEGRAHRPLMVTKIVDRNGKVIYNAQVKDKQAVPYRTSYLVQQLLRGGLTEPGGTTAALWEWIHDLSRNTDFGGKTGTSNSHSDAWFVGVTPHIVCGAWVGGEYRCIHFRTGSLGQGSRTALPICGDFFKSLLNDPAFAHYGGHFAKAKEDIDAGCYNCRGTYRARRVANDSVQTDSAGSHHATEGEKAEEPKNNGEVNFDDVMNEE